MFFEKNISSKITKEDYEKIEKIIKANKDKYDNLSHFIRCGVIQLIRIENGEKVIDGEGRTKTIQEMGF